MKKTTSGKITALICDYVRQENTGKYLLIGVYGESLIVNMLPAVVSFSLYFEIPAQKLGPLAIDVRISLDQKPVASIHAEVDVTQEAALQIGFPPTQIGVQKDGVLTVEVSLRGGPWETVLQRGVRTMTPAEFGFFPHPAVETRIVEKI